MTSGILGGVRVLDLSGITAGGRTTQLLGDVGADVIKIEAPLRPDPFRHWSGVTGEAGSGDLDNPPFRVVGRNKRGLSIDLKSDRGRDLFRCFVVGADIVIENFRRGVMEKLGIGFETLREWNDRIVLLSISSQGGDGPESQYVSFGGTLEALGGQMSVTGYDAEHPTWTTSKVNYPDQMVALIAPGLAIEGLMRARSSGRGLHIDLSQRELVVSLLGERLAEAILADESPVPRGNQDPRGTTLMLRAKGQDEWVAVTIASELQWSGLLAVISLPALATDHRFRTDAERRVHVEELTVAVQSWSQCLDKFEAADQLQRVGVPAAPVLRAWELEGQAHERDESFHVDVPTAAGGTERQVSWPFTLSGGPEPRIRRRAHHVGEQTRELLYEIGLGDQEIQELLVTGVVSEPTLAEHGSAVISGLGEE